MADSKKYDGSTWEHSLRKLTTATDTFTTLPADIYADGNNATVGISGNTVQSGTPSPSSPIQPQECGDLETTGVHAGQYKIPILSANTTTNIYIGEVETTRKIKKLVLTGDDDENWNITNNSKVLYLAVSDFLKEQGTICYCTHYKTVNNVSSADDVNDGECTFNGHLNWLYIKDSNYTSAQGFKNYLTAQYAAGTPVTVWYVLATPETGIVNEPLRKIGDYADTVSGITIPTIIGKDAFDVDTTLKPSEVSLSYTGWHDVTVKEKSDNLFDYNNPLDKIDNVYISVNGTIEAETLYYTCKIQAIENGTYTYRFAESSVFTRPTVGFYDSSDTLLSVAQHNANVSYFSFITPVNCAYMRVSIFKRKKQEAMLNSGSTALPYEPYWKTE